MILPKYADSTIWGIYGNNLYKGAPVYTPQTPTQTTLHNLSFTNTVLHT